jgi:hypothetical protein
MYIIHWSQSHRLKIQLAIDHFKHVEFELEVSKRKVILIFVVNLSVF